MISYTTSEFLKVSCVTVTNGRLELLKKSVQCYINQTYPNKELIILSQAQDNELIAEWVNGLNRDDIIFVEAPLDICLGEMRNASIELSHGDVICQWDDDDLYHSDRVMYQYQLLVSSSSNSSSCYTNFLKYFKQDRKMYWCDWKGEGGIRKFLCGSIMFYKKYYHVYDGYFYPEEGSQCHVEEDLNVLNKLSKYGDIACCVKGNHYIYVYHGKNTYGRDHHDLTLDTSGGKFVMNQEELIRRQEILTQTINDTEIKEGIDFFSLEGVAFRVGEI